MKMKSLKITHFFDVIKKEPISEDQHVVPVVEPDLNHVKQEYHYKEELDVAWDERDNKYGTEDYDVSNELPYKLGSFPIVLIERLPDNVINKRISSVQHKNEFENAVPIKFKGRGLLQHYQKFCAECKKREPSEKKSQECKNCDIRWNYECKKCSKKLSSYGGIINHLIKCLEQGNYYKRFKCNYKSIEKQKVNTHLKNVHSTSDSLSRIEKIRSENVQSDVIDAAKLHKCSKCSKQFQKLPQLLRHIQTCGQANSDSKSLVARIKGQDKYFHHCVQCNLTVKNDGAASYQRKKCQNCHSNFSFKCKKCNKILKSYSDMNQHVKTEHVDSKEVLKCQQCNYKTSCLRYLTKHFKRLHFIESRECPQCGRKCKNQSIFREHLRTCRKERKFQCDYCSYRSKRKGHLESHILCLHTVGNEIDCPQCGIKLKNKNCLKAHIKYCKKEPHHKCNICSYKTKYKLHLKIHCERVHSDAQEKEICPNCANEFKNKYTLRCHITRCGKIPMKNPELACKYCHRLFKAKSGLTQHFIRAHSDDEINHPYLHCDDCSYKTKFKGDLVKHVTIHQENNAKECSKCKKFFTSQYYKRHTSYCGEEPLRCDHCDYHTVSKQCLKNHIVNRHFKGNEIDCSKCGRTCKNRRYLKAHLQRCGTKTHL